MKNEIKMYPYVSYDGSPVGFILGGFEVKSGTEEYIPDRYGVDKNIRHMLECGLVRNSYGFDGCYIISVKEIDSYSIPEGMLYINMGFSFNCYEDYLRAIKFIKSCTSKQLSRLFGSAIRPSAESECGIVINGQIIDRLFEAIDDIPISYIDKKEYPESGFYIESRYNLEKKEPDDIRRDLGFDIKKEGCRYKKEDVKKGGLWKKLFHK